MDKRSEITEQPAINKRSARSVAMGAAFVMAMAAVGPGFLTQTATFTSKLGPNFGFAILVTILIDIVVQLNIWRIITVSGKHAQQIANDIFPGLGYFLTFLIVVGGFFFNIGNVAGAGLGLNVLFGISPENGAIIAAILAIIIFVVKNALTVMDRTVQLLAVVKIAVLIYILSVMTVPVSPAISHTFFPTHIDFYSIVTIVGGTVGGYISFAGGHRLLEGGVRGKEGLKYVNEGALTGIGIASVIRVMLFLAGLAVVLAGHKLDPANPAAAIFKIAAGNFGYKFFGILLFAAGMTSILGSTFTSVSFLNYSDSKDGADKFEKIRPYLVIAFIAISTLVFYFVGKPAQILVIVGAVNGLILPVALGILLIGSYQGKIMGATYRHPILLSIFGWIVVAFMAFAGVETLLTTKF
ncbi:NRAMP family divalent metal transporter [Fructobacillus ficulneus]|uniref:Manganese transporter NRAMP n=1 Tax=Fructobacillus ficulneus TaxID=157463 RepID=A0A0K8MIH0_9LACO|nr:NRAMP family divalent metal transporter [Fructobacillus ficulneus]GAP00367.1 manganese transporter NRAMP [Fructobacillus ficulneus]